MDGFTYFFNDPGTFRVKIGKTEVSTSSRLSQLNSERTLAPTEYRELHSVESSDCHGLEKILHNIFDGSRKRGEWFELDLPEIILLCKMNTDHAEKILELGKCSLAEISDVINGDIAETIIEPKQTVSKKGRLERLNAKADRRLKNIKIGFSDGTGLKSIRNTRVASHVREQIERLEKLNGSN